MHAHFKSSELRAHQISPSGVTPHSSPSCSASEVQTVEMVKGPVVACELMDPAPSSTTLLYHTLVQDCAVPPGFQHEFETLASAIEGGTARESRKAASTTEFDAALLLHERSEELRHKVRAEKSVADQLLQAATVRPRKYRARYLRAQFQGPSARKDAEESERNRWTTELADLLRGTQCCFSVKKAAPGQREEERKHHCPRGGVREGGHTAPPNRREGNILPLLRSPPAFPSLL